MINENETRDFYNMELIDVATGELIDGKVAISTKRLTQDNERLRLEGINCECHASNVFTTFVENDSYEIAEIWDVRDDWLLGYVPELDITVICQGTFINGVNLYSIELVGFSYGQISEQEIGPELCTRQTIHY